MKKSASIVLASLKSSTYRKGTPRLLARCGRAGGLFDHPPGNLPNHLPVIARYLCAKAAHESAT